MSILNINCISKQYNKHQVIKELSLALMPGELVAVLGSNGKGKTTLFRMVLGLIKPDRGEIIFNGCPIDEVSRLNFGYLPEDRCLIKDLTVIEQLQFFIRLRKQHALFSSKVIDDWLVKVNALQYKNHLIRQLSKGNQQKVQLLCAIIHQPKILLLDEPFTGLDQENTILFTKVIQELKQQGTIILISSHQWLNCEYLIDRVVSLHRSDNYDIGLLKDLRMNNKKMLVGFTTSSAINLSHFGCLYYQEGEHSVYLIEEQFLARQAVEWLIGNPLVSEVSLECIPIKELIRYE